MTIHFRKFAFTTATNLSLLLAGVTCFSQTDDLPAALRQAAPGSDWTQAESVPLNFPAFHPQGLARAGDRNFLSTVEVIHRAEERGRGHLIEFDLDGNAVQRLELGEGPIYHPGGIDFDGEAIWIPVAEYRPDSSSIVYAVDPLTFRAEEVFRFADHLGAITHLRDSRILIAVSWGSRRVYEWDTERVDSRFRPIEPEHPRVIENPRQDLDYQDLQWIPGTSFVFASGVKRFPSPARGSAPFTLGGVDLIEFPGCRLVHGLSFSQTTPSGVNVCQNPFYMKRADGSLELWFIPEDNEATLYVYSPGN